VRFIAATLVALTLGLGLGLGPAAPALASEEHPTQGELEAELVCPTCQTPLEGSDAPAARDMKEFIRKHIAMGWTKSQIEDSLVAQLGPGVRGVPQTHGFDLLAWALPFAGIGVGAVALGGAAWYWSRNRPGDRLQPGVPGPELDPELDPALDTELDRRVDEELARFDA
jgi:cytochrome c-type biogenesis protein CcmH